MIKTIENHIRENIKEYIILLLIFIIGLIIGTMILNNSNDMQKQEISDYLNDFTSKVQEGSKPDYGKMFIKIIKKNLILVIIMAFLGVSIIGLPGLYIIIGYKGFSFGYTISAALAVMGTYKGMLLATTLMLFSKVVELPALFLLAISGIKMLKAIIKDRRIENVRYEGIKFSIRILISLALLTVSGLIETYLSSNLFISIAKYL